jgi:hypothetical protein
MVLNDDAGNLTPRVGLRFIASMLAPTGLVFCKEGQDLCSVFCLRM